MAVLRDRFGILGLSQAQKRILASHSYLVGVYLHDSCLPLSGPSLFGSPGFKLPDEVGAAPNRSPPRVPVGPGSPDIRPPDESGHG